MRRCSIQQWLQHSLLWWRTGRAQAQRTDRSDQMFTIAQAITARRSWADQGFGESTDDARRAMAGPGLAYAFIAEPVDPEVEAERIRCRRLFGDVFKRILEDGVRAAELPAQDLEISAACIVGAFTEALVGPTAPSRDGLRDGEHLVTANSALCLRAAGAPSQQ